MKTAPKRLKKALGGEIDGDKDKLAKEAVAKEARKQAAIALAKKTGVAQPNPDYPTADEWMVAKGHMNPTTAKQRASEAANIAREDDYTKRYHPSVTEAGQKVGSGRDVQFSNTGNKVITNPNGTTETYDKDGNKLAKGGTVKMKKAPCKMKKGGTC